MIKVIVEDGIITHIRDIPPGIEVEIRDYDIQDEEDIKIDEDGNKYVSDVWTGGIS